MFDCCVFSAFSFCRELSWFFFTQEWQVCKHLEIFMQQHSTWQYTNCDHRVLVGRYVTAVDRFSLIFPLKSLAIDLPLSAIVNETSAELFPLFSFSKLLANRKLILLGPNYFRSRCPSPQSRQSFLEKNRGPHRPAWASAIDRGSSVWTCTTVLALARLRIYDDYVWTCSVLSTTTYILLCLCR